MRKALIAGLTLGVLLSLAAFRAIDLWWWRTQTVKVAAARTGNLAFILSQYIHEMFVAADASLRQLSLHSQRIGGPHAPDAEWAPSLASASAGLTGVGSISVLDADGVIRHSTLPTLIGQSRRDQYVFKSLLTDTGDDFAINTPFRMVLEPKEFLIPVGRRLTTKEGRFDGIVVITILPAAPRDFFRTIDIGPRDMLWVFHPDGFILFREPSTTSPTGELAIGNPIFEAARNTDAPGVIQSAVTPAGPVMLTAYHVGPRPHLYVAISLDRSTLLADWRRQAVGSAVFFLVLALLLTGTLAVLFRQMDARRRVESELAVAQQLESARLTDVNAQLANALAAEQRARLEAEASGRLKDEFLMTVSHELRTPLTAIYGWTRMLEAGTLTDDQQQTALQTIERNVQMQTRLVDDLLDVSRGIGGRLRLDLRTVSPADIVSQAIETVRPAAQAKGIRIEAALDPDSGTIVCDPERLLQIVWNLLSNAIKFTHDGGRVQLFLARTGGRIELVVQDTGAGISAGFLPHVFERFRQEQSGPTRLYGGLGLGLAIVRHLVELHGGSVTASSDGEGCGATFRVELPVRARPPIETETPPAAVSGASPHPQRF